MRYLKLFESFDESKINEICKKYDITDYTINKDESIDVNGYVNFYNKGLYKLPIEFNKVGWFSCAWNMLKTLEGSPKEVNSDFYCTYNQLTSFENSPKIIRRDFYCDGNKINSFEYFPSYVKGDFSCDVNPIWYVWWLFKDTTKIELLNDFDIFRDEDSCTPSIIMDRLNDFLLTIGKKEVEKVIGYKNI